MKHVTPKEAAELLGVSTSSLRRWENEGKLRAIRTPGGQRRFVLAEVEKVAGVRTIVTVLYARVSTNGQRDNLNSQIEYLKSKYPNGEVVSEIGSGLNFRRKKFIAVLERINSGDVNQLVVAHPDRLFRFGFELVKWICSTAGCELLVESQSKLSPEAELVQDMLSIIHCFSSRLYGLRKYAGQVKKDLQNQYPSLALEEEIDQEVSQQCIENQAVSK
ncbi:ISSoc2, resolvase [Calothrix sp. NIES-4071]|nr:ISSoc2, resolvase [Calothrix sp. NIES-4071]BAZ60478.1 ISSoc2, resolvase [Calothrix sp. NIES-4105]